MQRSRPIRWYERYANIKAMMKASQYLPPHLQAEVCARLRLITFQYIQRLGDWQGVESLEANIFAHLKKSYEKKRWYDKSSDLHLVLNEMIFLPDPILKRINDECESVLTYIHSLSADNEK